MDDTTPAERPKMKFPPVDPTNRREVEVAQTVKIGDYLIKHGHVEAAYHVLKEHITREELKPYTDAAIDAVNEFILRGIVVDPTVGSGTPRDE